MPRIFVTRIIPEPGLDMLREHCEIELNMADRVLLKRELIEGIRDKEGLLCLLTDMIDEEVMNAAPCLKVISNYAVGYNNIDVKAATVRGIQVTNTPGVLTETTAEHTWALLMAAARRIPEADRFTRQGKFRGWSPTLFLGTDIRGKILGIVGMGRVGRAVARMASGFDLKILYTARQPLDSASEEAHRAHFAPLGALLCESDFITIHVPLVPETFHLIGAGELAAMKSSAILVNTSRGPVVDEKALAKALHAGVIRGAALDVYEDEPRLAEGLADLPNVVLSPHIASATLETRSRMAYLAALNLLSVLKGETPPHPVNEIRGRGFGAGNREALSQPLTPDP
ncbi:MAG: D-glycerate dehydrogenase [Armatimonadetes bacterium]|nr:D-glycerate dehydrogenase [Armatimonadota bacterium]